MVIPALAPRCALSWLRPYCLQVLSENDHRRRTTASPTGFVSQRGTRALERRKVPHVPQARLARGTARGGMKWGWGWSWRHEGSVTKGSSLHVQNQRRLVASSLSHAAPHVEVEGGVEIRVIASRDKEGKN